MAQIQGIDAATTTFKDAYGALPGDLSTASTRVQNCTASCLEGGTGGNGDGVIGLGTMVSPAGGGASTVIAPAAGAAPGGEQDGFWAMLADANLVSGVNGSAAVGATFETIGTGYPAGKIGGGLQVGTATDGYIYVANVNALGVATAPGKGTMTPAQAGQIDRKMDDGVPDTGSVLAGGTWGASAAPAVSPCATKGVGAIYNEADSTKDCGQYYRIQQ